MRLHTGLFLSLCGFGQIAVDLVFDDNITALRREHIIGVLPLELTARGAVIILQQVIAAWGRLRREKWPTRIRKQPVRR